MSKKTIIPILLALLALPGVQADETASAREVFWGTPNFSYAEDAMPPDKLREFGFRYMSHLIYWNQWETAPGVWNDAHIKNLVSRIDDLLGVGIVSGIRLGEAHPGARVWETENGKPYRGRNPKCYPEGQDDDALYFSYLAKLAASLRGRVDHYVLGDELDMIYGASFRNTERLDEYLRFFIEASKVIKKEDPSAKVVVFPFAWGEIPKNVALLKKGGLGRHADGFSVNLSSSQCENPTYLENIAAAIKGISPDYKLYSNGFGYLSDQLTEEGQAWRLAHVMITSWSAGFQYLPYYLPASNSTPWSDGLYRENLSKGGIIRRPAAAVFTRLSALLRRSPRPDSSGLEVKGFVTPFGTVTPEEFPEAGVKHLWQSDGTDSFGLLTLKRMNDPRVLRVQVSLPPGPHEAVLQVENVVNGAILWPDIKIDPQSGHKTAVVETSNEPRILRWKHRR